MTTHKALIGALPLIASALGDKYGVKVVFGNYPTAATNGNTIFMPNLPLENKAVGILANGFIDHEASHVKETEMAVFGRKDVKGLRKHLLNIVEDLRIERAMMNRYPGTRKNLARLVEHLVEVGFFSLDDDMSEADLLVSTALYCGRADVLSQEGLYDLANKSEERFTKALGKGPMVKLRALLKTAETLTSTRDALGLADKILAMLKEEQEKAEQQQQSQSDDSKDQKDDSSQSDDSDDSGSSSSDSDDDQAQNGDGSGGDQDGQDDSDDKGDSSSSDGDSDDQSDDQGDTSDDQSKDGDDSGTTGGDTSDSDDSSDANSGNGAGGDDDIAEALKRALEASDDDVTVKSDMGDAIADQLKQDLGDVPADSIVQCDASDEVEWLGSFPPVLRSDVKRESVKMRAKLIAKIETMLRERTYTARSGRKIEGRQLSRVAVGDSRIFRKTDEKRGLDTAIHVLVDRSGSMNGNRMEVAMKSTMALMSTFDNIKGVSSAASMFPGVTRLTDFHENVAQTKHRYVPSTLGTTPLGEALLWLIKDMANRRENRKMVIVLTDGAPNDPVICQKLIKRMEKFDIEVIGIGIETMAVEGLFPTSAVINQVKELPHKLFSLIQEKLVQ